MIRELLTQRINDYDNITQQIIGLYEESLIKALRFYTKSERNIKIKTVELFPLNHNFLIYGFSTDLIEGDKIKLPDGKIVIIDAKNLKSFDTELVKIVISIYAIETYNGLELYEMLKKMDAFIKEYGSNTYQKGLSSGIMNFEELLVNHNNSDIFDSVENPLISIIEELDDLQKLELEIYTEQLKTNRILH